MAPSITTEPMTPTDRSVARSVLRRGVFGCGCFSVVLLGVVAYISWLLFGPDGRVGDDPAAAQILLVILGGTFGFVFLFMGVLGFFAFRFTVLFDLFGGKSLVARGPVTHKDVRTTSNGTRTDAHVAGRRFNVSGKPCPEVGVPIEVRAGPWSKVVFDLRRLGG